MHGSTARRRNGHAKPIAWLVVLAVGMFGFAFALVPLYRVLCELTGLDGRTAALVPATADAAALTPEDRMVTIQFLAQVNKGMPWEFRPVQREMSVRVGELYTTEYYARNRSVRSVTGQAVPSVSPSFAALHLRKVECFCFTQQHLEPGEEIAMPVQFYVSAELPDDVRTLTLSYRMFRLPEAGGEQASLEALEQDRELELELEYDHDHDHDHEHDHAEPHPGHTSL